jgi:hypothetical protein
MGNGITPPSDRSADLYSLQLSLAVIVSLRGGSVYKSMRLAWLGLIGLARHSPPKHPLTYKAPLTHLAINE